MQCWSCFGFGPNNCRPPQNGRKNPNVQSSIKWLSSGPIVKVGICVDSQYTHLNRMRSYLVMNTCLLVTIPRVANHHDRLHLGAKKMINSCVTKMFLFLRRNGVFYVLNFAGHSKHMAQRRILRWCHRLSSFFCSEAHPSTTFGQLGLNSYNNSSYRI